MRTLYLVRHAEAVSRQEGIPDFERTLVPKGIKCARKAARHLARIGDRPRLLLSSPASRALETAHLFAGELDIPVQDILLQNKLYDVVEPEQIVSLIRGINPDESAVAIFGHDPLLSDLVSTLVRGVHVSLPKGSVVGIQWPDSEWTGIQAGSGRLCYYDPPLSKSDRKQLQDEAYKELFDRLKHQVDEMELGLNGELPAKQTRRLRKGRRELARLLIDTAARRGYYQRRCARALEAKTPAGSEAA